MKLRVILALVLLCTFGAGCNLPAQLASPFSNSVWPAQTFTASSQTGTVMQLNGLTSSTSTVGSSFASGTLTLTGTSLTTVTFAVMGSSDNGATYYALPIYTVASPSTSPTTTITATANGIYQISLAGITHLKIVTSGTFTATNVSFVLDASPNVSVAKGGTGGGGTPCVTAALAIQYNLSGAFGCASSMTVNPTTGVITANGFATGTSSQGVIFLVQNSTAAPSQPANSYALLAPQSGLTSSYSNIVPLLAPTLVNSVMASPIGGGQLVWLQPIYSNVDNTINTGDAIPFTVQNTTAGGGVGIAYTPSGGSNAYQTYAGGSSFAQDWWVVYNVTANVQSFAVASGGTWIPSGNFYGWGSSGTPGSQDTYLYRASVGVVECGSPGGAGACAFEAQSYIQTNRCNSSASPAACGTSASGVVAVPAGSNPTLTIDTSAFSALSSIGFTDNQALGSTLGVTCNTTLPTGPIVVTAQTPGTSITIEVPGTFTTNPVCISFGGFQ